MIPANDGDVPTVTAKGEDTAPVPQAFEPATVMLPETAVAEKSTVMLFVLEPAVITAPAGNVQV